MVQSKKGQRRQQKPHNSQRRKQVTKQKDTGSKKSVIALIGGVLIVGIVILIAYFSSSSKVYSACTVPGKDPILVNNCKSEKCTFDVTLCELDCPFGYYNEDNCPVSCECATAGQFEGDIQFNEESLPVFLSEYGLVEEGSKLSIFGGGSVGRYDSLWGDNVVDDLFYMYYEADTTLTGDAQFKAAIKEFDDRTCIRIRPKPAEDPLYYLTITTRQDRGCGSAVGKAIWRVERKKQFLNLGPGCVFPNIIIHELMHALGFLHEQARNDRNEFVRINNNNIEPSKMHNFKFIATEIALDLGSPYDYDSLMHYDTFAFSSNGQPVMTLLKREDQTITKGNTFSEQDLFELNRLYPCPSKGGKVVPYSVSKENKGDIRYKTFVDREGVTKHVWAFWGPWSSTCECMGDEVPYHVRRRVCAQGAGNCGDPRAYYEKSECQGEVPCSQRERQWSDWYPWGACQGECGDGESIRLRGRLCYGQGVAEGQLCDGNHMSSEVCQVTCPGDLSTTIATTTTSSSGQLTTASTTPPYTTIPTTTTAFTQRPLPITTATVRTIATTSTFPIRTPGLLTTTRVITTQSTWQTNKVVTTTNQPSPVNNRLAWSPWGAYSSCSVTCGTQKHESCQRTRTCLKGNEIKTGCPGSSKEYKFCYVRYPCPVDGKPQKTTVHSGSSGITPGEGWYCGTPSSNSGLQAPRILGKSAINSGYDAPIPPASLFHLVPEKMEGICKDLPGSHVKQTGWIFGDFNGDKKEDVLCSSNGNLYIGYGSSDGKITNKRWKGKGPMCDIESTIIGDFNGDDSDDIACSGDRGTNVYLSKNGKFESPSVYSDEFCAASSAKSIYPKPQLIALDVNGDGKDDMLCRYSPSGDFDLRINKIN